MTRLKIAAITILVLAFMPDVAMAQSNRSLEQLSNLNRINPLQNPEYDRGSKILNRKIIDRKNKVVGRVEDIIVNENGTIASLKTDFDRLRLGNDIYLNYRSMRVRALSNAYALNMDSNEIADLYPELLADIDTASGNNSDTFSVRKITGAFLKTRSGKKIGKVENVLFGSNGGIARALYVKLSHGVQRGDTIAVPFRNVKFSAQNGRLQGTIENDFAKAILKIADD